MSQISGKIFYMRRLIYPLTTISGSALGLLALVKISSIENEEAFKNLLIIMLSQVGSGFIQCWCPFFALIKKNEEELKNNLILIFPSLAVIIPILFFSIPMALSFGMGALSSSTFQYLISKKKGTLTIFWALFIHSSVIISLSLPNNIFIKNWGYFYPIMYFFIFTIYLRVFNLVNFKEIFKNFHFFTFKFNYFNSQNLIKKSINYLFSFKENKKIIMRIVIAFITSLIYSFSSLLIALVTPVQNLTTLLIFDRVSFSTCSSLIKRFEVKGFFEKTNLNMNKLNIINFSLFSIISISTFLFIIKFINLYPFNSNTIIKALNNPYISIYENKLELVEIFKTLLIISIISLANSLQINSGYPVKGLQYCSQKYLKISFRKDNFRKYLLIISAFLFGVFAVLFQFNDQLALKNLFEKFNYLSLFLPSLVLLIWWSFVSLWITYCYRSLLYKFSIPQDYKLD